MEINSVNNASPLASGWSAADSIPVFSTPASSTQPVMANAVKAMDSAEKTATGRKATDPRTAGADRAALKEKTESSTDMAKVRESLDSLSRTSGLQFSVDDELGRVVVKVLDPETQEVLKQFPSEDALALARSLHGGKGSLHRAEA